jgi:hypothetical protein
MRLRVASRPRTIRAGAVSNTHRANPAATGKDTHVVRAGRFLALLLVAAVSTPTFAQQPQTGTAVVAGRVMDMVTANPVGGASVTLAMVAATTPAGPPGPPSPSAPTRRVAATANDDGRFVFRDVPAGTYTLTSSFAGLSPGAHGQRRPAGPSKPITIADGARESSLIVPMWRLGTISGTVRDDRGEPVVGVAVGVLRRMLNNSTGRVEMVSVGGEATDDRGRYRVSNLLPGTYAVAVRTHLRTNPVADVDAYYAAAGSGTAMPLLRRFRETGVINHTDSGLVVGEWLVGVSHGDAQPMPGPNGTLLVHPTTFYPNARASGEATLITLATGADRSGVDMTLPLVQGMRVSGVLTGPDGPAVNYGLRISPVSGGDVAFEIPIVYAMTDSRGRFAFLGVPPGAYVIRVYRVQPVGPLFVPPTAGGAPGTRVEYVDPSSSPLPSWFGELPVTVGSAHVDGLSITMEPGARVSGRIVFDGATPPPPPARLQQVSISIRPQFGMPDGPPNDARANAQGQFATQGFAPGRYVVQNVTTPGPEWSLASIRFGSSDAAVQAVTIGAQDVGDVVVTFTDKTITLSGDVRAAESGAPPDATVVLFPADYQSWIASGMSPRRTVTAVTSATGAYQLKVPLPGDYLVVAIPPEIAPEIDAEFVKRVSASGVRVTLAAGDSKTQALTVAKVR